MWACQHWDGGCLAAHSESLSGSPAALLRPHRCLRQQRVLVNGWVYYLGKLGSV